MRGKMNFSMIKNSILVLLFLSPCLSFAKQGDEPNLDRIGQVDYNEGKENTGQLPGAMDEFMRQMSYSEVPIAEIEQGSTGNPPMYRTGSVVEKGAGSKSSDNSGSSSNK